MDIAGIDYEVGLENCGDDEDVYNIVVETYIEEAYENRDKLLEYRSNDIANFTIIAHALKSANNNIGALDLGEKFRLLEFAGKDNDADYIESNVDSVCDELTSLVAALEDYLDE